MIWYLASPYSHKDPEVVSARFHQTQKATVWLLGQKFWTYSPIVHCHELAQKFALPTDAKYWEEYNHTMIEQLTGVVVLLIPGWRESKGVYTEILHALSLKKPIKEIVECKDSFAFSDGNYFMKVSGP